MQLFVYDDGESIQKMVMAKNEEQARGLLGYGSDEDRMKDLPNLRIVTKPIIMTHGEWLETK